MTKKFQEKLSYANYSAAIFGPYAGERGDYSLSVRNTAYARFTFHALNMPDHIISKMMGILMKCWITYSTQNVVFCTAFLKSADNFDEI